MKNMISLVSGCLSDSEICQSPESMSITDMQQHLFRTAVPRGKQNAGYIQTAEGAEDIATCILFCCQAKLCNVAWFTLGKCYLIECNEKQEYACEPVKQSEEKFEDTYFVQIRTISKYF